MGNSKIQKLREKLMEELENCYKDVPMDTQRLDNVYKLSESIKAIDTICAMEEYGDEEGYSRNSYAGGNGGGSSNRGRSRDSMGRYSGASYSSQNRWPMSYDDAKFNMVHKLNDLMMCTENEHTKSVLRNAIGQLEMG